jgi:hypothetical protein
LTSPTRRSRRVTTATVAGLVVGAIPYFLVLLNFRTDPLRTAVQQRFASNFFDLQASAFLEGRLDVQPGVLGIEGFIVDGKTYMYFPPFPALLRVPVQLLTHSLDGRLTVPSMALAWVVLAVFAARLLWLVRDCIRPESPVSRVDAIGAAVVLAMVTGGTVLTFDAALPWVYHEVYLWATALAVGSAYWLLRTALEPSPRTIALLGSFILATALTRTPGGWAMSAAAIGLGTWIALRGRRPRRGTGRGTGRGTDRRGGGSRRVGPATGGLVALAGAVPLAASIAYNAVKFGHPYLFPLESQVWTAVNAHRREALRVNGGTITGPQFLETSLVNYFRPDGIRFVDYFPWITLPAEPARSYGGAFLDQTYRTGSVTAFMPLLVLLAVAALPTLLNPRARGAVAALRWPALGALATGGGVMGYGYLANRYTSDFVPALVVLGTVGWVTLSGWLVRLPRPSRPLALVPMALLTAFSIAAQVATGSLLAAQTHRGPELVSYLDLQHRVSGGRGGTTADLLSRSEDLPDGGGADDLHVVGDCESLYLNTGDRYEPWTLVEQRDMQVDVLPVFERYRAGIVRLIDQQGAEARHVSLEFDHALPEARLVVEDPDGNFYSPWFEVERGRNIRITTHTEPQRSLTRIRVGRTARYDLHVPINEWNTDWYNEPSRLVFVRDHYGGATDHAIVTNNWGPAPSLCRRLASDAPETENR